MRPAPLAFGVGTAALASFLPIDAFADFLADSKAELELRNFYFNSDYRQSGARQSKREEWAQGFILDYQSGFSEGPVGFGVDALGMLGLKLDSGPDRQNTGLLPVGDDRAPDEYSKLGLTGKVRVSKSTLKVGTLIPRMQTVRSSDSRLLPQTFQGVQLLSKEIEGLTFNAGRLAQNRVRNDSANEDMTATGSGLTGGRTSDRFDFAGASYRWSKALTTLYDYGRLDQNYEQHMFNVLHVLPVGKHQSLETDLRYARSRKAGSSNVDNDAYGAKFTYNLGHHAFGVAYQQMDGETGFPHLNGTDSYLVNYVMLSPDFANPGERSWQVRYDYDFAALGLPGLAFMTRYLKGDHFEGPGGVAGREWERDTELEYSFQTGALKNFKVRWRNGTYRSRNDTALDQNRLILSYTLLLL
ncbi:OprD family porin [Pseudomonas oryzihabitans]|uniref:OprD family porin n=1 Tax=Pseudomonas oryzihabitans TaxID=47885 RepID=UPI0028945623|nr:OprD family porin [Pseudomonas oryzihabitans]MDT3718237.1 OprD family porin [Pseudomonas oryzihabitans]